MEGLSPVERAICQGLMDGQSQADIARALGCHRSTVCKQLARIAAKFRKWGLDAYVPGPRSRHQQPAENGQ